MNRILNSPEFNATAAQREFLQYVVEKTLAGQSDEIKGYTVATQVFGRGEDFDQATDPIVSIQANKLRRALERYYLVAGQRDPIRIDIPKGAYVPTFHRRTDSVSAALPHSGRITDPSLEKVWPTLCVQSLANLTGNPELDPLGIAIAEEMALEITQYQEIRVLMNSPERRGRRASDIGARFVLNGSLIDDLGGLKVIVRLTDLATGVQVWGESYQADVNPAHLMHFGEGVAKAVAGNISSEYGIIARKLFVESRNKPSSQLNTYEALLRYYQFNATFTAETFHDAANAVWRACQNEPECGLAWSVLARLHAINYGTELFDPVLPIEDVLGFAQTSVRLDPANRRTRGILAFVLMLKDEIPAARTEADRTLALNSHSFIFLENIGYLLTLLGDWQRGPALVRKAIAVNPHYNFIVHHALWLDRFRQEAYEAAHLETLSFKTPMLFWDPVIRAATLGLLGRIREGRTAAGELLRLKPQFAQRGALLLRRFIKSEEIVQRMADGLRCVGIEVESP